MRQSPEQEDAVCGEEGTCVVRRDQIDGGSRRMATYPGPLVGYPKWVGQGRVLSGRDRQQRRLFSGIPERMGPRNNPRQAGFESNPVQSSHQFNYQSN